MASKKSTDDLVYKTPIEHDAAIGRIARGWGSLEWDIDHTIWELAEVEHKYGACLTSQMVSVFQKLQAFKGLVAAKGGSSALLKRITKFENEIRRIAEQRNRAVHDARMVNNATGETVRLQTTAKQGKITFGFFPENITDLESVQREIRDRIVQFRAIRDDVNRELNANDEKTKPALQTIRRHPPNPTKVGS